MAGRWPETEEALLEQLRQAAAARDKTIADSHRQLIDAVQAAVDEGEVTIGTAAGVIGSTRVTLSRALNARGGAKRPGGGRGHRNDAETRQRLLEASIAHEKAEQAARDAFLDQITAALADDRATLLAIADGLKIHRTTLRRQLDELAARRAAELGSAGE